MSLVEISAPALLLALSLGFQPVQAQSSDEKIQQLEQKVDELDQRLRIAERQKEIKSQNDLNKVYIDNMTNQLNVIKGMLSAQRIDAIESGRKGNN